jgi:hypothetical protein
MQSPVGDWIRPSLLECGMRWNRPYPYDNDPTVRLGQMIGDVLFAILVVYMVWGLFFN